MKPILRVALVLCATIVTVSAASAAPQSSPAAVQARRFVGTYIEDIDIIRSGPFADFLVMTQGDGVYGAPLNARDRHALRKLVDYRGVLNALPRGLAYLADERAFALVEGASCNDLVIFDAPSGTFAGRRPIQHRNGYAPDYCEGLARIPAGTSYAGDLLLASMDTIDGLARLEVLQIDGQVVTEIDPPAPAGQAVLSALAVTRDNAILVGVDGALDSGDAQIWTIDFNGSEIAPRVTLSQGFVEGIAEAADGRLLVTGPRSEVRMFDASWQPVPSEDRDYQLGLGWTNPRGIAWNTATGQFDVEASDGASANELLSVSPAIDSATPLVDLFTVTDGSGNTWFPSIPGALAYMPGVNRTVVANPDGSLTRRGLFLFDGGTMTQRIGLFGLLQPERPSRVEYLRDTNELVVAFRGLAVPGVRVYSPSGSLIRQFDPRPAGSTAIVLGIAAFDGPDATERLLFFLSDEQAVVTDAWGIPIGEPFNWRTTLGVMEPTDLAQVPAGPYAGAFAVTEGSTGSVTFFTLP